MALIKYTLLRLALLVATGAVLWLLDLRGFWLLLAALLVSGIISIFALSRARDDVSTSLMTRRQTISDRLDSSDDGWDVDESAEHQPDREPDREG